jgi:hypothetical protein
MPTINEILGRNIDQYTKNTNYKNNGFIYYFYDKDGLGSDIKFFIDLNLKKPLLPWELNNYQNSIDFKIYSSTPNVYGNATGEKGPITFYIPVTQDKSQYSDQILNIYNSIENNYDSISKGGKRRRKTNKNKKRRSKKSKRRRIS